VDKLPYDFDLVYDIQYYYELVREYCDAKRRYLGLKALCECHGIPLPQEDELQEPPHELDKEIA
jgi:hypothetical protein